MKKNLLLLGVFSLSLAFVTSCKKEPGTEPTTETVTVNASEFSDWQYFSFEKGEVIDLAEVGDCETSKTKTNWDLAFHRGDIRTNSGVSGSGKGGALLTESTKLDDEIDIPASGYTVDEEAEIMIEMGADGYRTQSKNETLAAWYSSNGMPPVYVVNDLLFIVKTADGKYAKVKFLDYTNDEGAGGHVKFTYQYPVE